MGRLVFGRGDLYEALSDALRSAGGPYVPVDAWAPDALSPHLRFRFLVVDEQRKTVGVGRSLGGLRAELSRKAAESLARLPEGPYNRAGVSTWEWEELPRETELRDGLKRVMLYPAVVDEGAAGQVSVRLQVEQTCSGGMSPP